MAKGDILSDGSVEGEKFTKNVKCPRPPSMTDEETFGEYKSRIDKLVEEFGFHKGDLSNGAWHDYCRGTYDRNSMAHDEDTHMIENERQEAEDEDYYNDNNYPY